jgi:hypothetical protein
MEITLGNGGAINDSQKNTQRNQKAAHHTEGFS